MKKVIAVLCLLAIFTQIALSDPKPPVWSPSFYIAYDETFVKDSKSYTFNGQIYYDANNNRQRADKVDGKYDGICGSVLPGVSTPCQQLVVDNKRFVIFPKKEQCCFCCDAEHGCGLLRPDFFAKGKYLGQEKIVDTMYDKWVQTCNIFIKYRNPRCLLLGYCR